MDDLPLVEEAAGDALLLLGTTLPSPFTPAESRAFVERQWGRQTSGQGLSQAITLAGEAVGCATLMLRRPGVADLGYWLLDRVRGNSVGGRAVRLLVAWALAQPAVEAVEAFVADDNRASRRLLERLDFVVVDRRRHTVNDLDEELLVYHRAVEARDGTSP